jgi:hypothetical protein
VDAVAEGAVAVDRPVQPRQVRGELAALVRLGGELKGRPAAQPGSGQRAAISVPVATSRLVTLVTSAVVSRRVPPSSVRISA